MGLIDFDKSWIASAETVGNPRWFLKAVPEIPIKSPISKYLSTISKVGVITPSISIDSLMPPRPSARSIGDSRVSAI